MHAVNLFSALKNVVMNPSSVFLVANFGAGSTGWWTKVVNFVMNLFYAVLKWVLYLVDVVFSYVQQLAGLNMRWDSLDSVFSADSDMVFNLLWSSKDTILPIIKALIVLAVVLIIFFSIVAIIKTSFESLKGTGQNQTMEAIKKALKAFVLMLLTPMIALVGIVASNAILQTLYNATNVSGAVSLSSQVFSAASASANSYRIYANNNYRIPIMYDFTREDEILDYYSENEITAEFLNYLKSSDNITYATYMMFKFDQFFTYDSLNNITGSATNGDVESYYTVYDVKKDLEGNGSALDKFKRIENYREEYFVMADVVDFCVRTTTPVYFKTIEQVLESIVSLSVDDVQKERIFDTMVSYFGIKFLDANLNELVGEDKINSKNFEKSSKWQAIRWVSNYMTGNGGVDPNVRMPIQYTHLRNAQNGDELEGAKYVIVTERNITSSDGVSNTYFYPLTVGDTGSYDSVFTSSHILRGQMISAKGIFEDGIYPTAIKQNSANDVQFYRDKIESSVVGVAGSIFGLSMQDNGGSGFLSSIIGFFKMLFDPSSLVPKLDVDFDAVTNSYTATVSTVNTLSGGKMHISYMFGDVFTKGILKSAYVLSVSDLFQQLKFNYLILVMGALILIKVSISAVFMLINRAYELFLIIIVYPTACATIPLENGGYDTWVKNYTNRLFGTYGAILGINFVLLMFPVISSIHFFDPSTVNTNIQIRRIGGLFFSAFSVTEVTNMLNFATAIIFELVLFTMLSDKGGNGVSKLINDIVGGDQASENPMDSFVQGIVKVGKVLTLPMKAAGGVVKVGATMVVPSKRKAFLNKAKDKAIGALPGSSIIAAGKDSWNIHKKKKDMKDAQKDLKEALGSNLSTKEEVEKKLQEYQKKQKSYAEAIKDPHKARMAEMAKMKEQKGLGVSSREEDDPDDLGIDTADLSKKELKRLGGKGLIRGRKTRSYIRKLKKKDKKHGLSEEEAKTLNTYTKLREQSREELQNRKNKESEYKGLDKKLKNGEISNEEYMNLKQEKKEFKDLNKGKGLNKARKDKKKAIERQNASREEMAEREKLFRHTDRSSVKQQNRVLEKYDREISSLSEELRMSGFNGDVNSMSNAEINDAATNKDISQEQRELLTELLNKRQERQGLININKREYEAKSDNEIAKNQRKDIKKGINSSSKELSDKEQERADLVNQKIAEMEEAGINSSNASKYRKLLSEQAKFNVQTQEYNDTSRKPVAQSKDSNKMKKLRSEAEDFIINKGKVPTEELIQQYIDNVIKNSKDGKKYKK